MVNCFYVLLAMLLFGVMPLAGCQQRPTPKASVEQLHVMVSIAPQKYFVERIGNGYVIVNVMVPPGAEPHTFEPKPAQLKALSHSSAYMRIRIDFESAWMGKIKAANPKMLVVDTTQGIERMPTTAGYQEGGKARTDKSDNLDPHIWLSPPLVRIQAQTIANALMQLDTKHKQVYQANLERFVADIDTLDADIRKSLQGVKHRKFIVFHPSWGYFARDYGLEMIPIQIGGQEPRAAELATLITKAKTEDIKVVFAEPEFSTQSAETIAREIGGEVLLLNPLSPDWLNNLRTVADTFAKVLNQDRRIQNSEVRSQESGDRRQKTEVLGSLHPTPYTLHPTPYTLFITHPSPLTL
ncbi:metal ABC transporter solute-binding protein, Zn/Mn family [Chroococcidiopsis sp.]|uniref:metal ABC transporter solute-binding protein, Zn/Mn family n=1 Tax=Chroococcidiopsis sp. TaxID=3088168 RepID=UPI003F313BFB